MKETSLNIVENCSGWLWIRRKHPISMFGTHTQVLSACGLQFLLKNVICAQFTLLLSDLVKLLAQLLILLLIVGSQTLALLQKATDMCNIALHLAKIYNSL